MPAPHIAALMPLRIEVFETKDGFTAIVGDMFAAGLTRDEALGVVASALFSETRRPMYVRTYEEWVSWNGWLTKTPAQPPAGLLAWSGKAAPAAA